MSNEPGLQLRYKRGKEKSAVIDDSKKGKAVKIAKSKISLVGIHQKRGLTFARIERKTPVFQSNQGSLCGLHSSRYQQGEDDQMARSSA